MADSDINKKLLVYHTLHQINSVLTLAQSQILALESAGVCAPGVLGVLRGLVLHIQREVTESVRSGMVEE